MPASSPLETTQTNNGITVAGQLSGPHASQLLDAVIFWCRHHQGTELRLDLSGVTGIDMAGVRALLSSARCADGRDIELVLTDISPTVGRALRAAKSAELFRYLDSGDTAGGPPRVIH